MSSQEDTEMLKVRQDKPANNPFPAPTTYREEFYRLGCMALKVVLLLITEAAAARWGRRLELMSQSAYLPEMGYGDTNAIAACLDLKEPGAEQQLRRNHVPSRRPGERNLFRFADVVQKFEPVKPNEPEPKTTHGRCAKKTTGVSTSRKPRKK